MGFDPNWVTALSSAAVAALTLFLLFENRSLRLAGSSPDVVAYLIPDDRHLNILNLVIANVGRGPAFDIYIDCQADEENFKANGVSPFFYRKKMVLHALPPGEKVVYLFGNSLDFYSDDHPLKGFEIRIDYRSAWHLYQHGEFPVYPLDFEGMSRVNAADHEAAEALKQIAAEVRKWTSQGRLAVETMTRAEVQRQLKEWRESARERKPKPKEE